MESILFLVFLVDFQQNPFNTNGGQRLSPQQQQINQQLLSNFQQGNNSNSNNASQLSPRQPTFTQQSPNPSQGSPANWNQQSATNIRLNLQQTNPMLNAQLSVTQNFNFLSYYLTNNVSFSAATAKRDLRQPTTICHTTAEIAEFPRSNSIASEQL